MPGGIRYNPDLNLGAGYLKIVDEPENSKRGDIKPMTSRDRKSLLHLLFWALYTLDGRDFMRANLPAQGEEKLSVDQIAALREKFAFYGITAPDLQQAILDSHLHAELYAREVRGAEKDGRARNVESMALHEKIYLQNMAFVTWSLWEDAKDHEFSLGW